MDAWCGVVQESFEMTLEDTGNEDLMFQVYDKGDGSTFDDTLMSEATFNLSQLPLEAPYQGWIDCKDARRGTPAGSLHFVVTKHMQTLEEVEQEVTEGPRVLLKVTLPPVSFARFFSRHEMSDVGACHACALA
jgi:hypothetical protein